jgi:transcriptional regulator with XRE-family HTH domain
MVKLKTPTPLTRLRGLRSERGLSQMDMALNLGCSTTTFWAVENGVRTPSPEERQKIARLLGVPPSEIFPSEAA